MKEYCCRKEFQATIIIEAEGDTQEEANQLAEKAESLIFCDGHVCESIAWDLGLANSPTEYMADGGPLAIDISKK